MIRTGQSSGTVARLSPRQGNASRCVDRTKGIELFGSVQQRSTTCYVGKLFRSALSHDAPSEYNESIDMDHDLPRRWQPGEWEDETKHNRMGFYGTGPCTEGSGNAVEGAQKNFTEAYWRK